MSNFAFLTFFYKSVHISGTRRSTVPRKDAFDSSFNALSHVSSVLPEKKNGLASREQKTKHSCFYQKRFSIITRLCHDVDFAVIVFPLVEMRRMNNDLTLKGHVEN